MSKKELLEISLLLLLVFLKQKRKYKKTARIPEWTLNTIYNDLDALPVNDGRSSKKIEHLAIDFSKTWRQNGFGYV